jgi:hypothetical protein
MATELCSHGTTCPQCEAEDAAWEAERERRAREVESLGYRLVTGGQTSHPDEDGRSDWVVKDYRTGEVLASGHSTFDEQLEANETDPAGWYGVDFLMDDRCYPPDRLPV